MSSPYAALALSYRDWNYRVAPRGLEHMDPTISFAALQAVNLFSLLMLVPSRMVPLWLFVSLPFVFGAISFWRTNRIYRSAPAPVTFARLSDRVPGLREFPLVYGYLFFTLALFAGCLCVAVQGTT